MSADLTHHRRPVRVLAADQGGDAGDVRGRHRRTGHVAELLPPLFGGATAAMTSTPGAMMSGLSRSPPPARAGPRDEKPATIGALIGTWQHVGDGRRRAGAVSAYALIGAPATLSTWIVGTEWKSALSELRAALNSIMPTPPALSTARLLSTRALAGEPAALAEHDLAGDLRRVETGVMPLLAMSVRVGEALRTATGRTGEAGVDRVDQRSRADTRPTPTPWYDAPLPSVTVLTVLRSWVLAATVVNHGELCATVLAPGPVVAGRGGDEDATRGGVEERDLEPGRR